MTDNDSETAMERSGLHGLFAALFRAELTPELLRHLRQPDVQALLADLGADFGEDFATRSDSELLDELAVEYTALFLGPGGHISPHESVQADGGEGLLWGPRTLQVKAFIEAAGFDYKPDYHGIPDHIAVEFEFMAAMARAESEALKADEAETARTYRDLQRDFLREHLGQWAPAFFNAVIDRADLPFYREAARLAAAFLEEERAVLTKPEFTD